MNGGEEIKFGATAHKNFTDFAVWVKNAKKVWVIIGIDEFNWSEFEMISTVEDVWEAKIGDAAAGMHYKYKIELDGGEILYKNDPYARQLTDGEDIASVITNDSKFKWGKRDFNAKPINEQVIYEMHIGSFNRQNSYTTGTFATALEKLDYIKNLGVNTIELMPITKMSNEGWGYSPVSIFAVENSYGGRAGLLEFVKKCHNNGIAVILDVVYNHFANTDLWEFNGEDNVYFPNDDRVNTPWGARPDYSQPEVQRLILDNAKSWIEEFHIDGLRLDSTIYLRNKNGENNRPDTDVPGSWELLQKLSKLTHKLNKNFLLIAEDCGENEWITKKIDDGGAGFDAQWNLEFPHKLRETFTENKADEFVEFIKKIDYKQVIFSDSHDSAANDDERIVEKFAKPEAESLLANALSLTLPGLPMILQGSEFLQNGKFNATSSLNWEQSNLYHGIVLAHKHLIDLRLNKYNHTNGLVSEKMEITHYDEKNKVLVYNRDGVICIANLSENVFDEYEIPNLSGEYWVRFNSSWNGYDPSFANNLYDKVIDGKIKLSEYQFLILSK